MCRERDVTVDAAAFDAAMARQKEQARAAGKFKMAAGLEYSGVATDFQGYEHLVQEGAQVTAIYVDGASVQQASAGDDAVIVLNKTPFYAESGGQCGDSGDLRNATSRFVVEDTLKIQADVFGHHGRVVEGAIKVGDTINAKVDAELRALAKVLREHLAELTSAEWYHTDRRLEVSAASLEVLNASLADLHVEATAVLIRAVTFREEYERQLQQIQLNEQNKLLDRAREILWLIDGAAKADMLPRVKRGDTAIPAGRVRNANAVAIEQINQRLGWKLNISDLLRARRA